MWSHLDGDSNALHLAFTLNHSSKHVHDLLLGIKVELARTLVKIWPIHYKLSVLLSEWEHEVTELLKRELVAI